MTEPKYKLETSAIEQIAAALDPLDQEARLRVFKYCAGVFNIKSNLDEKDDESTEDLGSENEHKDSNSPKMMERKAPLHHGKVIDIRSFAEEKKAHKDIDRAAVVAYFLSQMAPAADRTNAIGTEEIKDYFIQAGYELPSEARFTLQNAKNAGYFKNIGHGKYQLTSVGHNLVAHRLPSSATVTTPKTKTTKKKK
jgi:hypothetical protein